MFLTYKLNDSARDIWLVPKFKIVLLLRFTNAYLCFLASIESDTIRYTGLEICNGVILGFDCRGLWWGGHLKSLSTKGIGTVRHTVSGGG